MVQSGAVQVRPPGVHALVYGVQPGNPSSLSVCYDWLTVKGREFKSLTG